MKITRLNFLLGFCLALGYVNSALADTFTLRFENIVSPPDVTASVGNYYNGSGGATNNFGVTFSSNALAVCLSTPGDLCTNTSRGGLGDPTSQGGGLTFVDGNDLVLNYGAGFINSLDFFYTSVNFGGSISIFSDADGGGSLLATMNLSTTPWPCGSPYDSDFCPFSATSIAFSGTGKSAVFTTTNDNPDPDFGPPQMVLDDITMTRVGDENNPGGPSAVPEPSTLVLLVTGAATAGAGLRRRMKAARP